MFFEQSEQEAGCTGGTEKAGMCGRETHPVALQDELTGALIGLARSCQTGRPTEDTTRVIVEGLFTTIKNVNFNPEMFLEMIAKVHEEKARVVPDCSSCTAPCGNTSDFDMSQIWNAKEDERSLESLILLGIRGMAVYAYHAMMLGYEDQQVNEYFITALCMISYGLSVEDLLPTVMQAGEINLKCMELLDKANAESCG